MSTLNTKALSSIIFTDTLKSHSDVHTIITLLSDEIKKVPDYTNLHMNVDLVVYICKCLDQILTDSKLKNIDKFNLFKQVYLILFPDTSDKEFITIKNIIEFLHNIKKISSVKNNYQKGFRMFKSGFNTIINVLSFSRIKMNTMLLTTIHLGGSISLKITVVSIVLVFL